MHEVIPLPGASVKPTPSPDQVQQLLEDAMCCAMLLTRAGRYDDAAEIVGVAAALAEWMDPDDDAEKSETEKNP